MSWIELVVCVNKQFLRQLLRQCRQPLPAVIGVRAATGDGSSVAERWMGEGGSFDREVLGFDREVLGFDREVTSGRVGSCDLDIRVCWRLGTQRPLEGEEGKTDEAAALGRLLQRCRRQGARRL